MSQIAELNDAEIIADVLNGEKEKYALLIRRYNQRLYRVCKCYIRSEDEIEDVMQETYVKAYVNLATFEGRSRFDTWLTRILINESIQRRKKQGRNTMLTEQHANGNRPGVIHHSTPESVSIRKEMKKLLEEKLTALPRIYRTVFILREIEKLNVAETAETLMISESNVKVRLNRAKEILRRSLLDECPLEELYDFKAPRCLRVAALAFSRI